MIDAVERLINLALYFDAAREPVTAKAVRRDVEGYPSEQDEAAFLRMFERDKDDLRAAGFAIVTDAAGDGVYSLDRSSTFCAQIELSPEDAAVVRAVGSALLDDPAFPFAEDLRLALAKIAASLDGAEIPAAARLADEAPEEQGRLAARLSNAAARRKMVTFEYTNSMGERASHEVEPFGLFVHDGRWYMVGRDTARDETRTYALSRMADVATHDARPKTADFEHPEGFDIRRFILLPFQYGPEDALFEATIRFDADSGWRAEGVSAGHGELQVLPDAEGMLWRVGARSAERLLRFVIEHGPGLEIAEPEWLRADLAERLAEVVGAHG